MLSMQGDAWPLPKDRGGVTFITIKGVRHRVEGTGRSLPALLRMVKAGESDVTSDPATEEGER